MSFTSSTPAGGGDHPRSIPDACAKNHRLLLDGTKPNLDHLDAGGPKALRHLRGCKDPQSERAVGLNYARPGIIKQTGGI